MGQMIENLPLPDAESLRKLSGRHFLLAQKGEHPLAKGLWLIVFAHHRIFPCHKIRIRRTYSKIKGEIKSQA
jgi:hypothetical protein